MKKALLVLFVVCLAMFAQSSNSTSGTSYITAGTGALKWSSLVQANNQPVVKNFAVVYTLLEADQFTTYAVMCTNIGSCPHPTRRVEHTVFYETRAEALQFVNDGFAVYGLMGTDPELVGIYELKPVKLITKTTTVETPQPPVVTTKKTYSVEECR